jgi:TolB-like protein
MASSTYYPNIVVSLTTSSGTEGFNMHSALVTNVTDMSGGGSTLTFADGSTVDVTESVSDIDGLVTAAGGTVIT